MHHPPPISVTVGRAAWQKHVVMFLWLIGVAASFAFVMQQTTVWQRWIVPLTCVLAGWLAWQNWSQSLTGRLQWDGQTWNWTHFDASPVMQLRIILDFHIYMLIFLVSARGQRTWLWLHANQDATSWRTLRRALVHADKGLPKQVQIPARG